MADPPFRILVVCIGNICRSPLAERLLRLRLDQLGAGAAFEVSSAGVRGMVGHPMHPESAAQLVALGGDPAEFVARRLTAPLVEEADLVLAATTEIRSAVVAEAPTALRRTFTLREFALLAADLETDAASPAEVVAEAARRRGRLAGRDLDVPDPIGRSTEVHEQAARIAAEAVETVASVLARCDRG